MSPLTLFFFGLTTLKVVVDGTALGVVAAPDFGAGGVEEEDSGDGKPLT